MRCSAENPLRIRAVQIHTDSTSCYLSLPLFFFKPPIKSEEPNYLPVCLEMQSLLQHSSLFYGAAAFCSSHVSTWLSVWGKLRLSGMQEFILSCWTLNLATVNNFLFCVMLTNELSSASSENSAGACRLQQEIWARWSSFCKKKNLYTTYYSVEIFFFFNGAHRLIVSAAENNQLLSCGDSFQMRTPGLL